MWFWRSRGFLDIFVWLITIQTLITRYQRERQPTRDSSPPGATKTAIKAPSGSIPKLGLVNFAFRNISPWKPLAFRVFLATHPRLQINPPISRSMLRLAELSGHSGSESLHGRGPAQKTWHGYMDKEVGQNLRQLFVFFLGGWLAPFL